MFEAAGSGGSELGDRVVFWFGFGQGVNMSGEEALVTYRPADNISGSGDLSAKPNSSWETHILTNTHIYTIPEDMLNIHNNIFNNNINFILFYKNGLEQKTGICT